MPDPNRFLHGPFAPAEEEITAFDLPVTGTLPAGLNGRYLRNGPNPLGLEDPGYRFWEGHWFLGPGMVHGVRLRDGKAEWYRNRWVRSRQLAEAMARRTGPRRHGLRRQYPHHRPRRALPGHRRGRPAALRAVQ
jgi:carotenoid cleavage dioxygenase